MTSSGERIGGRYRLDELLGSGAMSEVWCAHDLELDRTVAVKLLAPTADPARFRREARAVASLAHENVTQVFDYGEEGDRPYMVLQYLPGGTLGERLTPGEPLPPADAAAVTTGIAAGLAHAHGRGVVHRDLKPANILFDEEGRPKLADFGIARRAAAERTLTEEGAVIGTANYLSPEQAAGRPAGPASDVYSLGVIAFLLLTGRLPFVSDNAMELAEMHRSAPPPPIAPLPPGVPPSLVAFTEAALVKDPTARPRDGGAALALLAGGATPFTGTDATAILPAAAAAGPALRTRRRGGTVLTAAALVALALAGSALAWFVTRPSSASPIGTTGGVPPGMTLTRAQQRGTMPATRSVVDTSTSPVTSAATTAQSTTTRSASTRAATTTRPTTTRSTTTAATTATTLPTTTTTPPTVTTSGGTTAGATTTATTTTGP